MATQPEPESLGNVVAVGFITSVFPLMIYIGAVGADGVLEQLVLPIGVAIPFLWTAFAVALRYTRSGRAVVTSLTPKRRNRTALFVRLRMFLQRTFILAGWGAFAYYFFGLIIFGGEQQASDYLTVKAVSSIFLFPVAGHSFAYIIRVGDYHSTEG